MTTLDTVDLATLRQNLRARTAWGSSALLGGIALGPDAGCSRNPCPGCHGTGGGGCRCPTARERRDRVVGCLVPAAGGMRTEGRSPLFRAALTGVGLHAIPHLAAVVVTRGYAHERSPHRSSLPRSRSGRYLVAPRGHAEWVRNIRVAGGGELRLGPKTEPITVTELADAQKPPVIRAYLKRWGWEVGRFLDGLTHRATEDELLAAAPGVPVFRIG